MEKFYVSFRNEVGDWERQPIESHDLRHMTSEARDLQRILSQDRKDSGAYYAVFKEDEGNIDSLIYSASGY